MCKSTSAARIAILVCGVLLAGTASGSNAKHKHHIHRRQTSDVQTGCKLPPPQQNGQFTPSRYRCPPNNTEPLCQMTPGNLVPHNWPLYHSCNQGYALNRSNPASVCLDGRWRPPLPGCVALCPALKVQDVRLKCEFKGQEVSCDDGAKPGTLVGAVCDSFYRTSFQMVCQDGGDWVRLNQSSVSVAGGMDFDNSSIIRCIPDCGITPKAEESDDILAPSNEERVTKPGEFPWVASIYRKYQHSWHIACIGTLITPHIILTSAVCVTDESNGKMEKLGPENIRVGLGKRYNNFYKGESSSVRPEVAKVVIPESFKGYSKDIALIGLLVDVALSNFILPVCADWTYVYRPDEISSVKVAGWSYSKNGTSEERFTTDKPLSVTENAICSKMPKYESIKKYITADKFCIDPSDGSYFSFTVFRILQGAAVTYEKGGRQFLIGLLSTKPYNVEMSLFVSNVTFEENARWLEREMRLLKEEHLCVECNL